MLALRSVAVTVLLGLVMAMTQAPPASAASAAPTPSPSSPMAGEAFHLTGTLDEVDPAKQWVLLQRQSGGTWSTVASQGTSGTYDFAVRINTSTSFRVAAHKAGGGYTVSSTKYVRVASQYVGASIERVCNASNDCGNSAKASGFVRPLRPAPRSVVLQYRSGSSWKSTSIRGYTQANGDFELPAFSITGWSQWKIRQLRVVVGRYAGSAYGASAPISFMPGPTRLGDNVLRVDVDGGAYPATKGVAYRGFATLIEQGSTTPTIKRARLDNFGVRGSTTAAYPKKPYNFRFQDAPSTDVFGMDADRRWTLLAMYADQSYVRDKTALDLGRKLGGMSWNPDSEYVELFVNSQYMGAYLFTEKVDIDGDKVDVGKNTGMIMETDMDTVSDYRKGFRAARSGTIFAFKEPDGLGAPDGITPSKLSAIKNRVAKAEAYLYSSYRTKWTSQLDAQSAADFYLAQEFIKDTDADFWRSKYFTWDTVNGACGSELCDGKLHFGPLWDFDKSIGNIDPTNPATAFIRSYRGWHANGTGVPKAHHVTYRTHWFAQLWKVPSWRSYVKYRWGQTRAHFWRAYAQEVEANQALIGWGAPNDRRRWAGYSKLYQPKGSTYNAEVGYVTSWLKNRFAWMDSQL